MVEIDQDGLSDVANAGPAIGELALHGRRPREGQGARLYGGAEATRREKAAGVCQSEDGAPKATGCLLGN